MKQYYTLFCLLTTVFLNANHLAAQQVKEPRIVKEWVEPFQPFRIVGNLYYVGTYDLACYLIHTTAGNILINTGLAASTQQIRKNIEGLGFNFNNIKILLTMQAHYDHVGALEEIRKLTKAKVLADEKDVDVLESGGASDYEMGKYGVTFQPVQVDTELTDGDTVSLGNTHLVLLHHPGHTKGSCSYLVEENQGDKRYRVLIANLPSIIVDEPFSRVTKYPTIASDYAYTLDAMKNLKFDLWVAAHASQFNMHQKHKPGDRDDPEVFRDQAGFTEAMAALQSAYDNKLRQGQ